MSYTFKCPFCEARIEVPDELDNTSANCPACGQEIYLTRADAVEDADPVVDEIRREALECDRRHMDQLRMIAMMQQSESMADARSKRVANILLWLFLWGPLCVIGLYLLFICLFRVAAGHW